MNLFSKKNEYGINVKENNNQKTVLSAFHGGFFGPSYYYYILLVVICRFLCDVIEGFNEKEFYNRTEDESFINFGSNFAYHPLFRDLSYFLGSLICGFIFFIYYYFFLLFFIDVFF